LALALFNSTCQVPIWLSTSPCTIQHFYCSTPPYIVSPSSFCVGASLGFKLGASKFKLA
jgi:hypothetical protein